MGGAGEGRGRGRGRGRGEGGAGGGSETETETEKEGGGHTHIQQGRQTDRERYIPTKSEERRVGKEGRSRRSPYH